jgi:two-component system response regulator FlrC
LKAKILAADDREGIRLFIKSALTASGYEVKVAEDGFDALEKIKIEHFDLLITDLKMPKMDGMALLKKAKEVFPDMQVIVLTAHGSIDNAVAAIKEGAFDYLTKPLESPAVLRQTVAKAIAAKRSADGLSDNDYTMIAHSKEMKEIAKMVAKVAKTDATVLLTGKSGTGKEIVARQIHLKSSRRDNSFVAVNCAAISPSLMESEMFGYEKGAFTGADGQKAGSFEAAHKGTLFLDEVGELHPALQAKLLRVLQEHSFLRVGGTSLVKVDIRIIAATNRDLVKAVEHKRFREDLFHRLSVFPIHLPELVKRKSDIIPIASHLLRVIGGKLGMADLKLTDDAEKILLEYSWPGNIRELSNVLERAAILCDPPFIKKQDLLFMKSGFDKNEKNFNISPGSLKQLEKEAIEQALAKTNGHRKKAADILGIGLRTLYNKLREYEIEFVSETDKD